MQPKKYPPPPPYATCLRKQTFVYINMKVQCIYISYTYFVHELLGLCSILALHQENPVSILCYMYAYTNKCDYLHSDIASI